MHIEAELDDTHAERLFQLQQRFNQPLSETLAALIDSTWNQHMTLEAESDPSPLYQAFAAAGLIGCIATGEQLSATYKEKLDFSDKTGERAA
jgi:hypothetical protein